MTETQHTYFVAGSRKKTSPLISVEEYTSSVHAAIEAQARRTASAVIKSVARDYAQRPVALNALFPGIRYLAPHEMIKRLQRIVYPRYRWFGLGGEVPAINLRGAMLYARWRRAKDAKLAKRRTTA